MLYQTLSLGQYTFLVSRSLLIISSWPLYGELTLNKSTVELIISLNLLLLLYFLTKCALNFFLHYHDKKVNSAVTSYHGSLEPGFIERIQVFLPL